MSAPAFCGNCGSAVAAGEYLLHEGTAICGGCKERYFQKLREHVETPPTKPYPSLVSRVGRLVVHILWTSVVYGMIVMVISGSAYGPVKDFEPLVSVVVFLGALYAIPRLAARGDRRLRDNLVDAFLFPSLICFAGLLAGETAFILVVGAIVRYYNLNPRIPDERWGTIGLFIVAPIILSLFLTLALLVSGVRQWIARLISPKKPKRAP